MLRSHPTWVRGLKHDSIGQDSKNSASHPTWVRGLKHEDRKNLTDLSSVAPYVGAWIETSTSIRSMFMEISRTLRGCVD